MERYFALVTEVREALKAGHGPGTAEEELEVAG
jgi:hypothetical protein